jgi:hypothetical protein
VTRQFRVLIRRRNRQQKTGVPRFNPPAEPASTFSVAEPVLPVFLQQQREVHSSNSNSRRNQQHQLLLLHRNPSCSTTF